MFDIGDGSADAKQAAIEKLGVIYPKFNPNDVYDYMKYFSDAVATCKHLQLKNEFQN